MTTEAVVENGVAAPVIENVADDIEVTLNLDVAAPDAEDTAAEVDVAPEGQAVQYSKTGDVGLDMALNYIGGLGLGPAHPAVKAAQSGDFTFIKAELAGRNAPGWEQYVALAEKAFETATTAAKGVAAQTRTIVEETVGGADNWQAIHAWAKQNAEPEEAAQINGMLNAGGMQARAAAILLAQLYESANVVKDPKAVVNANAPRGAGPTSGPLSAADYQRELQALISKVGSHRVNDSPEYKQLQSRRLAFRG